MGALGRPSCGRPLLQIDAQSIGDSIHEGEVTDNRTGVVNRQIVESVVAERLDICLDHSIRVLSQFFCVGQQGLVGR